jgi:hypothetical protein
MVWSCVIPCNTLAASPGLVVGCAQSGDAIVDLLSMMLLLVYSSATRMVVLGVYCSGLLGALGTWFGCGVHVLVLLERGWLSWPICLGWLVVAICG